MSDRLRVRGIEGRSVSPVPDKDSFKVGYEGNHLGSAGVDFGEVSDDMPTPAIQFLLCGRYHTIVCESVSCLASSQRLLVSVMMNSVA